MKQFEVKKFTEDKVPGFRESRTSKKLALCLASLLALWTLSAKAKTKVWEEKKDTIEIIKDSTKKQQIDIWLIHEDDEKTIDENKPEIGWWGPDNDDESKKGWKWEIKGDKEERSQEAETDKIQKEAPVKFSFQTWVGYQIWWKAFRWNRVVWSWQLFKWTKWETDFFWFIDLDDPIKTKWQGKITLSKKIYEWISLDWDYTFTWSWTNIARFWLWYRGKMWPWTYKIVAYPLNSNWSPIAAKVQVWLKLWKNWRVDSFVFVDFDTKGYISETEYTHKLAKWIALFIQARLSGIYDWDFTSKDSQSIVTWLKFDIK